MTPRPAWPDPPRRVRTAYLDWLDAWLSERDWRVMATVNRLRVASGQQLERVCFASVAGERSRTVTRSRVLARLVAWRVLMPVGRRVGGSGRGSTVGAYALDSAGQRLMERQQLAAGQPVRVRRPGPPGERSLRHLLAVSELYAELVEAAAGGEDLAAFAAEPGGWWRDGLGGWLKPDAYAVLTRDGVRDSWWCEVDLATESLPTVRRKVEAYLDFRRRGERGPDGVMPWLLISTVSSQRRDAIAGVVRRLPEAGDLVRVVVSTEAAARLFEVLRE
jgi:Replication-relaxation